MFGVYFHIPYCLQRCTYCDFATFVYDQILPPEQYLDIVSSEIKKRKGLAPTNQLDSVYFGGGTPSLLKAEEIVFLLDELKKAGFIISNETEVTIEINPATLDKNKIQTLMQNGVNRFSVGAQTFDDQLLSAAGRKHSSSDTRNTLDLLAAQNANYSFDLLFALPHQTMSQLLADLDIIHQYSPPHLSAYCLTVPAGHPMSTNRPEDSEQSQMFSVIADSLKQKQLHRYEISNFAKKGKESRHNLLYWQDASYLGFGLSAHSYIRTLGPWGTRFWNPSSVSEYQKSVSQTDSDTPLSFLESIKHTEQLNLKQSLFDYCHTALRLDKGINLQNLQDKFSQEIIQPQINLFDELATQGLIEIHPHSLKLSEKGLLLSDLVFSRIHASSC